MTRAHSARELLLDGDAHDAVLERHVHPPEWKNPAPAGRYNLVVVGAGTAGLVAAGGGALLGGKVALVERRLMGGDCLNFGCVPSKALLRSASVAHTVRQAAAFGVDTAPPRVDFAKVMERVRALRAEIAPHDSAQRFQDMGAEVYLGEGRFVAPDALEVAGQRLTFARAIIATGGKSRLPDVPGLADVDFLTSETVFSLTSPPPRWVVLGGGPIGCELAQAFQRLGAEVSVVAKDPRLLPKDDPEAAALLARRLEAEGVRLYLGASVTRVEARGGVKRVHFERDGIAGVVEGEALLVATGRAPELGGLGLEAAGVRHGPHGVEVDDHLRTSNPRIYAAGDVASRFQFTHAAEALARLALQNALFLGRRKASALHIPWCTYTDPEVAHVGITAGEAASLGKRVVTLTLPLEEADRAIVDSEKEGFARLHVAARSGKVLGATLVGPRAGELISTVALMMAQGTSAMALGELVVPYPTYTEVLHKLGGEWFFHRLGARAKGALRRLLALRR
jgi:pyruvate/2-oxoglutarate dehydrogenase complex dihydrolipoamide dehydrogenase (E3) component